MNSNLFWNDIDNIIQSGFTESGLQKLEYYAELFINGRLIYKRFSPKEQYGCSVGGTANVIASLLTGADVSPDKFTTSVRRFKGEFQLAAAQEHVIETWARKKDCWIDDTEAHFSKQFGSTIAEGGEAKVFYNSGSSVLKSIGLDYYILPILALDRVALHNTYFPETRLHVIGFGRDTNGAFQIIVEQPFIQGMPMSDSEIIEFATKIGFTFRDARSWTYSTPQIYLSDLHDENVIRSASGTVYVIDCDIRLNTPDLKCGGIRSISKEIEFI